MGLITLDDLEIASGRIILSADEPRLQWYIDAVSGYIETYCDQRFSAVANDIFMAMADRRGAIEIPGLTAVASVQLRDNWLATFETLVSGGDYTWDGIDTIYGLTPYATYKITVSYGWETTPADIKNIVTELVMAGTGLAFGAKGGLKSKRTGDVEEQYGVTVEENGGPVVTLASLQRTVLDSYRTTTRTWRL